MNLLLKKQIAKYIKPYQIFDLKDFLNAVDESYDDYANQIELPQKVVLVTADEHKEISNKLAAENSELNEIIKTLSDILNAMNLETPKVYGENKSDLYTHISKQISEILIITTQREVVLKNLEKNNQKLYEYTFVVSHDLKEPLRNIDTIINWFIEENKDQIVADSLKSLEQVLLNVEKMDLLTKGILDYSTVDQVQSADRLLNLNQLITEVQSVMLIPKNFKIKINPSLPKICGNAWRFKQVFQNLLQNAITYNDKKNGLIEIGFIEQEHQFEFFVKDNGIGILEAYHDRIFTVFTKLESSKLSSGLGLSIVKKIIHIYNGKIWLKSEKNIGTTFFFTIPKTYGTT